MTKRDEAIDVFQYELKRQLARNGVALACRAFDYDRRLLMALAFEGGKYILEHEKDLGVLGHWTGRLQAIADSLEEADAKRNADRKSPE
jgi:hypothetical protein